MVQKIKLFLFFTFGAMLILFAVHFEANAQETVPG